MLSLSGIVKRFGALTALDGVSLELVSGECFGLLGPNGAGKSTLMSIIAGLRAPDAGMVSIDGRPVSTTDHAPRLRIGYVPQSIALYLDLSAEKNLRIFGQLYGLSGKRLEERVDTLLEAVQLTDRRKDKVGAFSGGMQRRLNIAAALLHEPGLLLCDEPTVGVDPQSRNAIFDHLEKLKADGLTIIYSTHYMEEAVRLCSRIGIIDHGKLLGLGTLDDLLTQLPFEDEITFPRTADTTPLAERVSSGGELITSDAESVFRPRPDFPLSRFYTAAESLGLPPRLFVIKRPTLEALFLHLTGRALRD